MAAFSVVNDRLNALLLANLRDYTIFMLDTGGRIQTWTPSVELLLGYTEAEFIGQPAELIFVPEERDQGILQRELQQARERGKAEDKRWHLRKDGTRFWANGEVIALRDDAGDLQGFAKILRDDTPRQLLQDRLQDATNRLQTALDAGSIGTWRWDIQSNVVVADPNLARFFGISAEDARGGPIEHYLRAIHPEEREVVQDAINESIATNKAFAQDYRLVQSDGSLLWVEARGKIEKDAQGTPLRLDGVVLDCTARKEAEAAQILSEERYRTLFNSIDVGFCVIQVLFDASSRPHDYLFVELNPAFAAQTGLGDANGKTARELVPGLDEFWFETYGQVALTGESARFENRADAMGRWFEVYAFPAGPAGSHKVGLLFTDITERKNMEAALQQSGDRYRILFESIDSGFCVIEMLFDAEQNPVDYRFLEVNPAFEHQTGLQQAKGKRMLELAPLHEKHWFEIYGHVALTGESIRFENQAETLDHWFDVYALRIGDPALHRVGLLFTDITVRKLAENALRNSRERAEETNRLKDEFLATLSHELRSPLNAILGWANLLRTNKLDEATQANGLEVIERNARSQAQLIEDLLDVSRILTGKLRLEFHPLELSRTLEEALLNATPTAEAKSIHLHSNIDTTTGFISGDGQRLAQVFWNLLSNAIKFTPRDGHIWVNMALVDSQVQIQITDTGRGISPQFLPFVFERFRQADASSTRSTGGLGIGLGLVKYLVEGHGGSVDAFSAGEGQGSTFTLTFPLLSVRPQTLPEPSPAAETRPVPEQALPVKMELPPLHGLHVLVVDDEQDAREIVAFTLKRRGAHVETANSAAGALVLIETARTTGPMFDILVSDVGMPEEDGHSLVRRLRAIEEEHKAEMLPAIALTAYASPKDRMKALMAGFQNHLTKPVDAMELVATVASLAGRTGHEE
jgi:PAS domain S-box-containing protein